MTKPGQRNSRRVLVKARFLEDFDNLGSPKIQRRSRHSHQPRDVGNRMIAEQTHELLLLRR